MSHFVYQLYLHVYEGERSECGQLKKIGDVVVVIQTNNQHAFNAKRRIPQHNPMVVQRLIRRTPWHKDPYCRGDNPQKMGGALQLPQTMNKHKNLIRDRIDVGEQHDATYILN